MNADEIPLLPIDVAISRARRRIASLEGSFPGCSAQADELRALIAAAEPRQKNWPDFQRELGGLLNKYGMEKPSDTKDSVLAEYLTQCLVAYNIATENRRSPETSNVIAMR